MTSLYVGLGRVLVGEQALRPRVGLDQRHHRLVASGQPQVLDRHGVDREDRHRRAVLGTHVRQRRAVGQRQARQARTEELDELADDAVLAQALGDGQHQVGRGRAGWRLAVQPEAQHRRNQHGNRLAEHRRLGLDAAHAPPDDAQAVHHRRVRVGTDQRVRIRPRDAAAVCAEHHAREVLEVHLVDDAGLGRHDAEVGERVLAPAEKRVTLPVARVLEVRVEVERVGRAEVVHLHGVVDDEFHRLERVDPVRIAAEAGHRVAHGREVDDGRHAREVLEQDPRGREDDLLLDVRRVIPVGQGLDVARLDRRAVLVAQQVLEQDLQRVRQARDAGKPGLLEGGQAVSTSRSPRGTRNPARRQTCSGMPCDQCLPGTPCTIMPRFSIAPARDLIPRRGAALRRRRAPARPRGGSRHLCRAGPARRREPPGCALRTPDPRSSGPSPPQPPLA